MSSPDVLIDNKSLSTGIDVILALMVFACLEIIALPLFDHGPPRPPHETQ